MAPVPGAGVVAGPSEWRGRREGKSILRNLGKKMGAVHVGNV